MSNGAPSLKNSLKVLADLVNKGTQVGIEVFDSLTGSDPSQIFCDVSNFLSGHAGAIGGCDCEIPPPCWMPRPLGDVCSCGSPGKVATVRFTITNCAMAIREVNVFTTTQNTVLAVIPAQITLGPMERGVIKASYTFPASAKPGDVTELLLWVRGCRLYFLRWDLRVVQKGADTAIDVKVKDCPDLVHHWYDHFYCPRPCPIPQREGRG
jgi:hypothetical protein